MSRVVLCGVLVLTLIGGAAAGATASDKPKTGATSAPAAPARPTGSTAELARQGSEHYAAGRYAEALAAFQAAAEQRPSPELLHDEAAAQFKLGNIPEARELWTRLKDQVGPGFEAQVRYNLGNCDYADALGLAAQPDKSSQSLEALQQAATQYRAALQLDPNLADARANLELAQLLRQQIEQQQKQQQQQQKKQPQSQPDSQPQTCSQPSEDQESGQPSSQPSSAPQSQPNKDQEKQPQTQPAESQPTSKPQQDPGEPDEDQDDQQQKPPSQPAAESQPAPQSQPAGAQSQPAESRPADQSPADDTGSPARMSRTEAERLLQMIRDAEKARREALLRRRQSREPPVDRDW